MKFAAVVWYFILTCSALAQREYREQAPSTGPWKDQPPGTWVVTKHVTRDGKEAQPRIEHERELLLGVDDRQKPWFAVYKSDLPSGPWTYAFGHGGGNSYDDDPRAKTTPAGEKTLTIGERSIPCAVTRFEMTDDASIYTGEVWRDRTGTIELQYSLTTRPRDADAKPFESIWQLKTVGLEQRIINGRDCTVFIQDSSDSSNGVIRATARLVVSPDVPGGRISFTRWKSADHSAPATSEAELIAWGKDLDALAEQKTRFGVDKGSPQDQMAQFHEGTLADAESGERVRRSRGLSTLAMNPFPPEQRQRIERVVRAGLTDGDVKVNRAAAEAAGYQQVAGKAARIVELSKADPDGAPQYIRALGRLADPAGLGVVLAAAKDPRGYLGDVGVEALANFADDRATTLLKELLASPDWTTRSRAVQRLGRGKNPHAVELLLSVINDPNEHVRAGALLGLLEKADPRGLDPAIKALNDSDPSVRSVAVMAVARIGERSADPRPAADALFPLLHEKTEPQMRASAALGLARLKDPRVLPTLKKLAVLPPEKDDTGMFALPSSATAFRALSIMGTPEALAVLVELSRDPQYATIALSALREVKSPQAARTAWELYRQPTPTLRTATAPPNSPSNSRATQRTITPEMRADLDHRSQISTIIVTQADKTLRNEIEASIPLSSPGQRPELRRLVRQIDERAPAATLPASP